MTNTNDSNSNIGSLQLVFDRDDLDSDVEIDEPRLARTDLWHDLCVRLEDQFVLASERLAEDCSTTTELYDHCLEEGLSEPVASAATAIAQRKQSGRAAIEQWAEIGHGGFGLDATGGGLEDIFEILSLLEAADQTPTVKLSLPLAWSEADGTRRSRWLSLLTRLSASLSISLVVSRLDMLTIVDQYQDAMPASTVSKARQTHLSGSAPIEAAATEAQRELGDDNAHWRVIAALLDEARESAPVASLSDHMYLSDVSRSAVSKRVTRLAELGLVDRITVDGSKFVSLLPAGAYAFSEVRSGDTASQTDRNPSSESDQTDGVNNPRKTYGITVDPQTSSGDPPTDRPSAEAASVTADVPRSRSKQRTDWLRADAHHAAVAATRDLDIAVCDDDLTASDHSADLGISKHGDEIVVVLEASRTMTRTATRLALALSDNRLMIPILNEIDEDDDFEGLIESDPVILRLARQIGWISEEHESGAALSNRLKAVRESMLDLLSQLGDGDDFNHDIAQELSRKAHGLAGTLTHLYEMAGYEVIRSIEVRDFSRNWNKPLSLVEWIATQQAICSRYGHYPLYRVQLEQDEENREAMLGAPVISPSDPEGTTVGKWVLRGSGLSHIEDALENLWSFLDPVDENRRNYRRFVIDLDVGTPGRNEIATALHRLAGMKNLEATRQTISVIHAFTDSIFDAAEALYALGGQDFGREREIYLQEVRVALSALSPAQIMPQVDNGSTGKIVHTLLERRGAITTAELANAAGVSRKTIAEKAKLLAGIGFVSIIDRGAGKAKHYRLELPWEREDAETKPEPLSDVWHGETETIHDRVYLLLERLNSPFPDWSDEWMDVVDGTATVYDLADTVGLWLRRWVDLLVRLLGATGPRSPPGPDRLQARLGTLPKPGQLSLDQAVDMMVRADGGNTV